MSTPTAAIAIVEALKDPALTDAARLGLIQALQAVDAQGVSARSPRAKAERPGRRARAVRITREAIERMQMPASGERYVYDLACPQLAVRLRPGAKTYVVVMWQRATHRTVKVTLGKCEALTPDQARTRAMGLVPDVAEGKDMRRGAPDLLTLRQVIERWHVEKHRTVRTSDEMRIKALDFLGRLADKPAASVTRAQIGAIHHHICTKARRRVLKGSGTARQRVEIGEPGLPATADKWMAVMCSVFSWAEDKQLIGPPPVLRTPLLAH